MQIMQQKVIPFNFYSKWEYVEGINKKKIVDSAFISSIVHHFIMGLREIVQW